LTYLGTSQIAFQECPSPLQVVQTRFGRNNCEDGYQQLVQSELWNRFALEKDQLEKGQLEVVASQVQEPSQVEQGSKEAEEEASAVQQTLKVEQVLKSHTLSEVDHALKADHALDVGHALEVDQASTG
jgi:hypothetical protein